MAGCGARWTSDPPAPLSLGKNKNHSPFTVALIPSFLPRERAGTYGTWTVCSERKNHSAHKPRHLTDFFLTREMQKSQDGAGAAPPPPHIPTDEQSQETELHFANASEDMDSTEPALGSHHGSPTDRGKRAAQLPVLSPTKAPLYKKQNWDAPGEAQHQDSSHESLASHPARDQPASEQTLKHMLICGWAALGAIRHLIPII